jgi:hypothetical protein
VSEPVDPCAAWFYTTWIIEFWIFQGTSPNYAESSTAKGVADVQPVTSFGIVLDPV